MNESEFIEYVSMYWEQICYLIRLDLTVAGGQGAKDVKAG